MAKSLNWTKEELGLLKEHYPRLGRCKELQELFPLRSMEGICLKANRIGLRVISNIREGRTNEEYNRLLDSTTFIPLESYKGSTEPILHKCKTCLLEWRARPQQLLRTNAKCPVCSLKGRISSKEHINAILDKSELFLHSDYTGALGIITVEHLSCGYIWNTVFSNIQQGSGCPVCNKGFGYSYSKGHFPTKASVYLLKVSLNNGEVFLKVGVTSRKLAARIRELKCALKELSPTIEVLAEVLGEGSWILLKEREILAKPFKKFVSSTKFSGSTELLAFNDDTLICILKEYNE